MTEPHIFKDGYNPLKKEGVRMMDDTIVKEPLSLEERNRLFWDKITKPPTYICPKHGEIHDALLVSIKIKELDGLYCHLCCAEKMIESGVHKVKEKIDGA